MDELSTERVGPDFVLPGTHGENDDTATEGARRAAPAPDPTHEPVTVGAATSLSDEAEPGPAPAPGVEAITEPTAAAGPWTTPAWSTPSGPSEPAAVPGAPGAPTSLPEAPVRNWLIPVLVAAVIGGLLGAGLVAALDRNKTTTTSTAFTHNQSVIAKPQDIQGILQRVQPGVVSVQTQLFQRSVFGDSIPAQGAGTGMIITADGDVLTNAHVVRGATSIKVTLFNEKSPRAADLVGSDPAQDVAVIHIRDASGLPTVRFGSSTETQVGDSVLAIGNALALPGGLSVTEGIVSAKDRSVEAQDEHLEGLIQTDAAINPGNSGGPLVNASGEVIGMNTAVIQSTGSELAQNIGFAIAIDTIKPLVQRLEKGGATVSSQAFAGISSVTMTPDIKQQYGFSVDKGAVVTEVTPGSPAENAGIQPGDVITKFGGQAIASNDELVAAVHGKKPGDKVQVTYVRGDKTITTTMVIGSRPGTASGGTGG